MSVLDVNNIQVVYQHTVQVLRGLSLTIAEGSIVAMLGANGAGKTTTLKAISGILPLENGEMSAGKIHFFGKNINQIAPHELVRRGLFHVMEGRRVFEDLSVEANLIAATYATNTRPKKEHIEEIYHYFPRLAERKRQEAGYLSGGEQQMLAIGRALIAKPKVMLLDEPSLGLAPKLVREIFDVIKRINSDRGVSMLLVEQNAALALSVANYGYIIENGRVAIDGSVEKLVANPDVQEFYLGMESHGGSKSFRNIKHYRRRKRWLS
tara:strand:+ start:356 stop:1153 length:798 start_codon:yes stop_codon:yes gene_type:complete